jgi:hypothetical protein
MHARTTTTLLRRLAIATVVLATAALLALPATGSAAQPKKGSSYTGATAQTNGQARLIVDYSGLVMSVSFDYACSKTASATRYTQDTWKLHLPHLQPSAAGAFKWVGKIKTWKLPRQLGFSDPTTPSVAGTLAVNGRFVTAQKAVGNFTLKSPGCKTGPVSWTATLGGR